MDVKARIRALGKDVILEPPLAGSFAELRGDVPSLQASARSHHSATDYNDSDGEQGSRDAAD